MKTTSTLFKKMILAAVAILTISTANAQLTVNGTLTPLQWVQNYLIGTGITVSNVTYTGVDTASGVFNGSSSNIGFSSGVLLTTGSINNAPGPNDATGTTTDYLTTSTDPQLTSIATSTLYDAAILEFDFVPVSDTIKFKYVFASEEYPEYVCSNFNDVFGFFLTGPNPGGGSYTNQNIAIIPGSTLAVAINTVNPGVAGANSGGGVCQSLAYSSLYTDNTGGATIEYDGFTVPLTAIAAVTCGQTYHIKLAISDVGDGAFDSGVFLQAGSFSSNAVQIVPHISYGGPNDSTLYEGCGQACIYFIRTSNLSQVDTIRVTIGGTAINGVDYNTGTTGVHLPDTLFFGIGQDSIIYCINAPADNTPDGLQTITLMITHSGPCQNDTTKAKIYLNEYPPLTVTTRDTTLCNQGGTVTLNTVVTGGVEPYIYSWTNGAAPVADPTVTVAATTNFIVTVNDACTGNPDPTPAVSDTATVNVILINDLTVNAGPDQTVCPDTPVNFNAIVTGGANSNPYVYQWSNYNASDSLYNYNNPHTGEPGHATSSYILTVTDFCLNTKSDTVKVNVETSCALNIPNVVSPDGAGPQKNDLFYIDGLDKYPGSALVIYNRWGVKLYDNGNYQNDWNGTKYSDGTYFYVLSVSDGRSLEGFFQIVRAR